MKTSRVDRPLTVESLETRAMLSCSTVQSGSQLTIVGDSGDNSVDISDDGLDTIAVDCDDDGVESFSGVRRVVVNTGRGDDWVDYSFDGDDLVRGRSIKITLGTGDDTAAVDAWFVDVKAALSVEINGGAGDDDVEVSLDVAEAPVRVELNGGAGDDWLTVDAVDAVLNLAVHGGSGDDFMDVDAAAGSTGSVTGGTGSDTALFWGKSFRNSSIEDVL